MIRFLCSGRCQGEVQKTKGLSRRADPRTDASAVRGQPLAFEELFALLGLSSSSVQLKAPPWKNVRIKLSDVTGLLMAVLGTAHVNQRSFLFRLCNHNFKRNSKYNVVVRSFHYLVKLGCSGCSWLKT